jgi:hypothetical protein
MSSVAADMYMSHANQTLAISSAKGNHAIFNIQSFNFFTIILLL